MRAERLNKLEVRRQPRAGCVTVHARGLRALFGVLVPGVGVLPGAEIARELRQLERVEGVAPDGELVRLAYPDRLLGQPRLRPVRQSGRVQRDRAHADALARAEVPADVIDHLLRLQVRV